MHKRDDIELATLARDIFEGRAIISFQIPVGSLPQVFMPLQFASAHDLQELGTICGAFFEYLPNNVAMDPDTQLPTLNTVQYLHVDDVDNLTTRFKALVALHQRAHRPKKGRTKIKKTKETK